MHEQLIQKELFRSYVNGNTFLVFNYAFVNKIQILKKNLCTLLLRTFQYIFYVSYSLLVFACHCVKIFDPVLLPLPHTHECIHFLCDEVDINIPASQLNRFLMAKLSY
jgi:hypothetical protein